MFSASTPVFPSHDPNELFTSAQFQDDDKGDSVRYLSDAYARYEEVRCDYIVITLWMKSSYGFFSDNTGVEAENIPQYLKLSMHTLEGSPWKAAGGTYDGHEMSSDREWVRTLTSRQNRAKFGSNCPRIVKTVKTDYETPDNGVNTYNVSKPRSFKVQFKMRNPYEFYRRNYHNDETVAIPTEIKPGGWISTDKVTDINDRARGPWECLMVTRAAHPTSLSVGSLSVSSVHISGQWSFRKLKADIGYTDL